MMAMILESALRTALTTALVWAILRLFRASYVVAQKAAWCLVLAAAVAMPCMMRWQAFNFPLPAALQSYLAIWPSAKVQITPRLHLTEQETVTSVPVYTRPPARQRTAKLYLFVATAYSIICAIFLLRLLVGLAQAFHVWRQARPVSDLSRMFMSVRTSREVNTPFTIGLGVVLPPSFDNWDPIKLQMVLAHERSHILQADFFLQLLARLHVAFFWFNPAAWWLQNELGELGEAISDHAAITQAPDRYSYAEVLLEFATQPSRPLAGLAMARANGMSRRIDRILNDALFRSAFTDGKTHICIAAAAFSLAVLVSTSHVLHAANQMSPPRPPAMQGIIEKPSIELSVAKSSQASATNPQVELLTSVTASEQTAAMQEVILIQQRAQDAWVKDMPQGAIPSAHIVSPDNTSQTQTVIEFSIAPNGHVSAMVLVHPSGLLTLDRSAWGALTQKEPIPAVPDRPIGSLRYRITFAYDNRAARQTNVDPQKNATADTTQPNRTTIQEPPKIVGAPGQSIYQVGGPVVAPELVWAPDPVFPSGQEKGGEVVVSCVIGVEGHPKQLVVVRHLGGVFDKNAVDAIEQYRFKPAMLLGKPVPVHVNIEVNFAPL
jgi:TonB family protein